ncbi:MAG: site-2 protease family protein [Gammaproteobacteria bacterium]|nr:site-2 protease family protein [Gammaproteobacteria bacterium]
MIGNELSTFQTIALSALPLVYAIVLHEVAHGWVANRLGDDTALRAGRLTLNPVRHIDLVGTIIVPLVLLLTAGFAFGWAKPVPVNFGRLHQPRRDMVLVAVAGPAANLLMAGFWVLVLKLAAMLAHTTPDASLALFYMALFGIIINAILMIFNLIPLPPADGGRIAVGILPRPAAMLLARIEPFGLIILVILLATGILGKLLNPVVSLSLELARQVSGL